MQNKNLQQSENENVNIKTNKFDDRFSSETLLQLFIKDRLKEKEINE